MGKALPRYARHSLRVRRAGLLSDANCVGEVPRRARLGMTTPDAHLQSRTDATELGAEQDHHIVHLGDA